MTVTMLFPEVAFEVCVAFHAGADDASICAGCGWTDEEHDFDVAA